MKYIINLALALFFITAVSAAEEGHEHKALDAGQITLFKTYPLNTCIVSDEAFGGEMGDALSFVHDGQEYTICCKSCIKKFAKDPAKYVAKLAEKKEAVHKADAPVKADPTAKKDEHADHDHGDHKH